MMYFRKKGDKIKYRFVDDQCIGRECWAPGHYQHRAPLSGGGSRNTGSPDTACCMTNAYRGCPSGPVGESQEMYEGQLVTISGLPTTDPDLAKQRKSEGWKKA